jgi:hypothetical protein
MVAAERTHGATWRPSIPFRILISGNLAPFSAVIGFVVWLSLPTGGLPGWWFVVLAVPLWLWLVYRAWTLSATLTPDALIVRGLLSARRIPLTDITAAGHLVQLARYVGAADRDRAAQAPRHLGDRAERVRAAGPAPRSRRGRRRHQGRRYAPSLLTPACP